MAYALSSSHKNCLHHTCVHCTLKLSTSACIQDCWQWPGWDLIEKHTHTRKNTISMGLVRFEWRYHISSKSRCGEILCQGLIWCVNNSRVASTDQHARAYTASIISLFVCTYNARMHTHTAIDPLLCSDIETPTILVWNCCCLICISMAPECTWKLQTPPLLVALLLTKPLHKSCTVLQRRTNFWLYSMLSPTYHH